MSKKKSFNKQAAARPVFRHGQTLDGYVTSELLDREIVIKGGGETVAYQRYVLFKPLDGSASIALLYEGNGPEDCPVTGQTLRVTVGYPRAMPDAYLKKYCQVIQTPGTSIQKILHGLKQPQTVTAARYEVLQDVPYLTPPANLKGRTLIIPDNNYEH